MEGNLKHYTLDAVFKNLRTRQFLYMLQKVPYIVLPTAYMGVYPKYEYHESLKHTFISYYFYIMTSITRNVVSNLQLSSSTKDVEQYSWC